MALVGGLGEGGALSGCRVEPGDDVAVGGQEGMALAHGVSALGQPGVPPAAHESRWSRSARVSRPRTLPSEDKMASAIARFLT